MYIVSSMWSTVTLNLIVSHIYNGCSESLDPQWHEKNLGDVDNRSSPRKVEIVGQTQIIVG